VIVALFVRSAVSIATHCNANALVGRRIVAALEACVNGTVRAAIANQGIPVVAIFSANN
jgi:hypothetical protein